ncbi:MAG: hypothetical protein J6T08_00675 [Lentisphaeria bacterium]|nr:hypothetical protein [Lentisphaeria bacterium]
MAIPKTGSAQNGRTKEIKIGDITVNCYENVPLAPAMNEPSVEVQPFQGGDAVNITADGGYQSITVTCEYSKANWEAIDAIRASATPVEVVLPDFTGDAIPAVSEGPTLTVNGTAVPTMTITINWTTTADVAGAE